MLTALKQRKDDTEGDSGEETTMPLTPEGLAKHIQTIDEKHDDAHIRLRTDLDRAEQEIDRVKKTQSDAEKVFAAFAATPPDVMKLRFTPSSVVAVCAVCVSIVGGFYGATSGMRSDMRDIATRMNTQEQVDIAYRKLQEERASSFKDSLETLRRQQELQRYETQSVKDLVNGLKERSR